MLTSSPLQIHWFSIFNSFMMVIFLVGLVSMILMRTLRKDYARYSREEDLDDLVRGWGGGGARAFVCKLSYQLYIGTNIYMCSTATSQSYTCTSIFFLYSTFTTCSYNRNCLYQYATILYIYIVILSVYTCVHCMCEYVWMRREWSFVLLPSRNVTWVMSMAGNRFTGMCSVPPLLLSSSLAWLAPGTSWLWLVWAASSLPSWETSTLSQSLDLLTHFFLLKGWSQPWML